MAGTPAAKQAECHAAVAALVMGVMPVIDEASPEFAPTSPEEVRRVVDRLFRAVEEVDPVAYLDATYHPQVTIHESPSLPYGGDYHGPDGVLAHAEAFLATWAPHQRRGDRAMNGEVAAVPDHAYVRWTLRVAERSFLFISHYRFSRGLIIESWMFPFDAAGLLDVYAQLTDAAEGSAEAAQP